MSLYKVLLFLAAFAVLNVETNPVLLNEEAAFDYVHLLKINQGEFVSQIVGTMLLVFFEQGEPSSWDPFYFNKNSSHILNTTGLSAAPGSLNISNPGILGLSNLRRRVSLNRTAKHVQMQARIPVCWLVGEYKLNVTTLPLNTTYKGEGQYFLIFENVSLQMAFDLQEEKGRVRVHNLETLLSFDDIFFQTHGLHVNDGEITDWNNISKTFKKSYDAQYNEWYRVVVDESVAFGLNVGMGNFEYGTDMDSILNAYEVTASIYPFQEQDLVFEI